MNQQTTVYTLLVNIGETIQNIGGGCHFLGNSPAEFFPAEWNMSHTLGDQSFP